jgi:hypothetical protein
MKKVQRRKGIKERGGEMERGRERGRSEKNPLQGGVWGGLIEWLLVTNFRN